MPHHHHRAAGFTLVELVMVIMIVGLLAIVVLPRALDLTAWRLRAYGDELQAQMLAMQRLALAQRRPVTATITAGGVDFAYTAGGAILSLPCPATASPCIAEGGSRSATFNVSNSGAASTSTGTALALTLASGSSSQAFRLESQTGLFRRLP